MIIPYYELKVRKCKPYVWTSYCLLPSWPEYTDPTIIQFSAFERDETFIHWKLSIHRNLKNNISFQSFYARESSSTSNWNNPTYPLNYNSISLTNCFESPHPTSIGLQTTLIFYQNCNIRLSLKDHILLLYRNVLGTITLDNTNTTHTQK